MSGGGIKNVFFSVDIFLRSERLISSGSASGQHVSLQHLQKPPAHNLCNIIPVSQANFKYRYLSVVTHFSVVYMNTFFHIIYCISGKAITYYPSFNDAKSFKLKISSYIMKGDIRNAQRNIFLTGANIVKKKSDKKISVSIQSHVVPRKNAGGVSQFMAFRIKD